MLSVSPEQARFPDWIKPASTEPAIKTVRKHSTSSSSQTRNRSASVSSLRSLTRPETSAWTPPWATKPPTPVRTGSSPSISASTETVTQQRNDPSSEQPSPAASGSRSAHAAEPEQRAESAGASLADLSWGNKWWPFQVVPPVTEPGLSGKGKGREGSGSLAAATESQPGGFLELFAGRGAVAASQQAKATTAHLDAAECELLNADLSTLNRVSTGSPSLPPTPAPPTPITKAAPPPPHKEHVFHGEGPYREADESSPRVSQEAFPFPTRPPGSPTPGSHYLPTSTFSSRPGTSAAGASKSALDGPAAMFSSLFSANPFGPTSPGDSVSGRPSHHRSFSSTAQSRKDQKNAETMLDDEDKQAVDDS